ncbi:PRD domain-containing protein [uncultured Clostridium sp.]|uniref:glucose PTS transporter transcription antiterminator GlcT n=1 Tax=uncultured Clostridium sp. TaxID=59620 RepID=UPI00262F335F|nr:PRD domain-containing protein [uncultured Clostridium sp.]
MKISLENDMVLIKVFNNNIILVKSEEEEKILFEKGIGFGKKNGAVIKEGTEIDKIFVIQNEKNIENFNKVIERTDKKLLGLFEEIIYEISKELNEELSENIHIGLVDHLGFAIKRLENNEEIQNPFLIEIETLYAKEFSLAEKVAKRIESEIDIDIPDGEIGFIAIHIHSARNGGKLSNTVRYSYLGNSIIELVEDELEIEIERKSLDYARFLTHIRFAIERIMTQNPIENDLRGVIKSKYKISYKIAKSVGVMIGEELKLEVSEDEVAYIAMHIERFRVSVKR